MSRGYVQGAISAVGHSAPRSIGKKTQKLFSFFLKKKKLFKLKSRVNTK